MLLSVFLQSAAGAGGGQMHFWIMIIAVFAVMYFFMIRPQKKKQKEIENFRNSLQVGQEVLTSGGFYGTIRTIEANVVIVEIAKGVSVKVDKSCIYVSPADAQAAGK